MSDRAVPSPPLAAASIIVSMSLIAIGNGLMFAWVPVRLSADGVAPWVAGAVITALAGGGLGGCLLAGHLVRRVGHARVFATLAATVILSVLAIAGSSAPGLWVAARALYGFAIAGLFVVAQSWLNDASENAWRGKVIATFYMSYVVGIGAGSFLLRYVALETVEAPLLSILFAALSILPVSLTRLPTPPPPELISIELRAVWRISPVGLAGLFAVGGLSMLVQGFAPIHAVAQGYTKDDVALLMFLMQFGMIGVQLPLGALSDRVDRRYVLVAATLLVIAGASVAMRIGPGSLAALIVVFALWAGATETIYAVANAHANDRADPRNYLSVSSTLLVAWSVSAFVVPAIATALTEIAGPRAFMGVAIAIAALYGAFVAWRVTRREPAAAEQQEPFQPITAQAPYTAEVSPHPPDEVAGTAD